MTQEIQDVARERIPSPSALREIREKLMLSQNELSRALGFGPNGADVIRAWEKGERGGKEFKPTPTAWAALRYLLMLVETLKAFGPDHAATAKMRRLLPEALR